MDYTQLDDCVSEILAEAENMTGGEWYGFIIKAERICIVSDLADPTSESLTAYPMNASDIELAGNVPHLIEVIKAQWALIQDLKQALLEMSSSGHADKA